MTFFTYIWAPLNATFHLCPHYTWVPLNDIFHLYLGATECHFSPMPTLYLGTEIRFFNPVLWVKIVHKQRVKGGYSFLLPFKTGSLGRVQKVCQTPFWQHMKNIPMELKNRRGIPEVP